MTSAREHLANRQRRCEAPSARPREMTFTGGKVLLGDAANVTRFGNVCQDDSTDCGNWTKSNLDGMIECYHDNSRT